MGNFVGHERLTVDATSGGVAFASVPSTAQSALVVIETADVRLGTSSDAPTSSSGFTFREDGWFVLMGNENLKNSRLIRTGSASATADITYFSGYDFPGVFSGRTQAEGVSDHDGVATGRTMRMGGVYRSSAPAVGNTDVADFFVDAAGRLEIAAAGAAHDAAATSINPVQIGVVYRATDPAVADGDVASLLGDAKGRAVVKVAQPASGEVLSQRYTSETDSSARHTMIDPTSGKKIRMVALVINFSSSTTTLVEIYFGSGAGISTTGTKAIAHVRVDKEDHPTVVIVWPDGAGPVGAADDDLSVRTDTDITSNFRCTIQYREE
jgi:hypothetical protein